MPDKQPSAAHLAYGAAAEQLVAERYRSGGYTILSRNWLARGGELDIVAARDRLIVFVEVKARRRPLIDSPATAVGIAKQRHLRRAAAQWFAAHPDHRRRQARFDVVAVSGDGPEPLIEIFAGAF